MLKWLKKIKGPGFMIEIEKSRTVDENGKSVEHGKRTTIINGKKTVLKW